ncbi:MAG: NADH-quinone oxidoreductase subunit A [Planctomycetota bacterium]|nr:MAG: NADH-quinone oxidoreductase subunit A [Planctomycetota bacterium]
MLFLSWLLNPRKTREIDLDIYECGMPVLDSARHPFSVKFYLVALTFVLFDIEAIFLFPWAVQYKKLALYGLVEMGIFIAILAFGWFYIYKKGALEWK